MQALPPGSRGIRLTQLPNTVLLANLMAASLQRRLGDLALAFSESVLEAIRGASLEELFGGSSAAHRAPAAPVRPRKAAAPRAPVGVRDASPVLAAGSKGRRGGRLSRRSPSDIERVVSEIVSLLGEHPEGLRAEQIRRHLGLVAKELPRPLKEGVDSGKLGKSGQKRATTYFVGGPRAAAAAAAAPTGRRARAASKTGRKAKRAAGKAGKRKSADNKKAVGKKTAKKRAPAKRKRAARRSRKSVAAK
jgi:hypothetical protein